LIATTSHVVVRFACDALPALTRSTDLAEADGKATDRTLTIVLLGTRNELLRMLIDSSRRAPRTRDILRISKWATKHLPRVGGRIKAT
jgi:hypothetical protein